MKKILSILIVSVTLSGCGLDRLCGSYQGTKEAKRKPQIGQRRHR